MLCMKRKDGDRIRISPNILIEVGFCDRHVCEWRYSVGGKTQDVKRYYDLYQPVEIIDRDILVRVNRPVSGKCAKFVIEAPLERVILRGEVRDESTP